VKQFNGFKIFAADKIHPVGLLTLRKEGFTVLKKYGLSNPDLINFIKKKTAFEKNISCLIVRSIRKFTVNEIERLSEISIKAICTASSGFDNIPIEACKKHSIKVINVSDGNYLAAAEHTIALLLNILKNVNKADIDMKSGRFESLKYHNYELAGKTIGIIGVGRVGSHVAKLCKAFGAKVIGNDVKKTLAHKYKWIKFKDLETLLIASDIITVHTPLDDSTKNMLDSKRLSLLKKNTIVLNCARGGIIDENALIRKLNNRKIYYAGIDVFENEPDIQRSFVKLDNVILTPHLAGKTIESNERISEQLAMNILKYYSKKYL